MNVLIVYAHPNKKSYTFQILELLTKTILNENHKIEISDLYALNFQSDMTEEEYEREGFANLDLPISKDVIEEQRKIEWADCVIFLYPVWWSDCPAKLKGWFDRVYSVGYAYGYDEDGKTQKMKTIKYGLVLCTAGHPVNFLEKIGIAKSMKNIMIDDRLGKRFEHKEMIILGGTLNKELVKDIHFKIVGNIGKKLSNYS